LYRRRSTLTFRANESYSIDDKYIIKEQHKLYRQLLGFFVVRKPMKTFENSIEEFGDLVTSFKENLITDVEFKLFSQKILYKTSKLNGILSNEEESGGTRRAFDNFKNDFIMNLYNVFSNGGNRYTCCYI
jgi:hypothetical protein